MEFKVYSINILDKVLELFSLYPVMFDERDMRDITLDLKRSNSPLLLRLICVDHGIIIGYIQASIPSDTKYTWKIDWIVVDQSYRKHGIGSRMVKICEEYIKQNGYTSLIVETLGATSDISISAISFYKKVGFHVAGQIPNYWSLGENKIIFSKTL
jgi:ribosomal protein S18 acetylase RimI-like enzyme